MRFFYAKSFLALFFFFLLSCPVLSFASTEMDPANYQLKSLEERQDYIQPEINRIERDIENFKSQFPTSVVSVKEHLNNLIQLEIDKHNKMPDAMKIIFPNYVVFRLNLAALCSIAVKERDAEALVLLRNYFLRDTFVAENPVISSSGLNRIAREEEKSRSIQDYPVYNLALECGAKSIPYLRKIVIERSACEDDIEMPTPVKEMNRFAAFAVLYHINKDEALVNIEEYKKTLDDSWKKYVDNFLKNPVLQPWLFSRLDVRSERMEQRQKNIEKQRESPR